jgi:glycolate oxidase FAD binding subunit
MRPTAISEIKEIVCTNSRVAPRGAGSKPALIFQDGFTQLEMRHISGLLTYEPQEFTFTALAGTPLAEIDHALAEHGQFLPFDPPLVRAGTTLGGCVASGLSGPGRYRYGGLRDFLLGVRFVDAQGQLISSGGKVVKNAAGFDLPKLMIGSLGQYGILVELSFKVFPRPEACTTLLVEVAALEQGLEALTHLTRQPYELFALDLLPQQEGAQLRLRLGGNPASFPQRIDQLQRSLPNSSISRVEGEPEQQLWQAENEFTWAPAGYSLAKVPITPRRVLALDEALAAAGAIRRYSVGANLAWVAWRGDLAALDSLLVRLDLSALLVRGTAPSPLLGVRAGEAFARRVKQALDPQGRFPEAFNAA